MPTYDYKCEACGHSWEEMLMIKDLEKPTKEPCPECGEMKVQNIICAPGVHSGDGSVGNRRPPNWFRDVEKRIKKQHPLGNMKTH